MTDPARLGVAVKPGAKHPGIDCTSETIVIRVRERAVDGAANGACIRALAESLGLAPSSVELLRGARARRKLFAIHGLTSEEALQRLRERS